MEVSTPPLWRSVHTSNQRAEEENFPLLNRGITTNKDPALCSVRAPPMGYRPFTTFYRHMPFLIQERRCSTRPSIEQCGGLHHTPMNCIMGYGPGFFDLSLSVELCTVQPGAALRGAIGGITRR